MTEISSMRPEKKDNSLKRWCISISLFIRAFRFLFSLHLSHIVPIGVPFLQAIQSLLYASLFSLLVSYLTTTRDPGSIVVLYAATDESRKPLKIHKEVVCHYSPVLKAAFESPFHEGQTQSYTFQDAGQNIVTLLIHVQRKSFRSVSTRCINYVYENTSPGSPLRKQFISWCAWSVQSNRFLEKPDHFPNEMLLDLVTYLSKAMPSDKKELRNKSRNITKFEVPIEDPE